MVADFGGNPVSAEYKLQAYIAGNLPITPAHDGIIKSIPGKLITLTDHKSIQSLFHRLIGSAKKLFLLGAVRNGQKFLDLCPNFRKPS